MGFELDHCMSDNDFRKFCETYQFSETEIKDYTGMEKRMMTLYLEKRRSEGDERDKNIIFIEWIRIYSEFFRIMWIMLIKGVR